MSHIVSITFKAVAIWKPQGFSPEGFIVTSNNPKINSGRHDSWEEAFEEYKELLKDFVETFIPSGDPDTKIEDPVFRGKSGRLSGNSNGFILHCEPEDLRITWLITILNHPNRTLDEFSDKTLQDKENGVSITFNPPLTATAGGSE